MVDPDDTNPDDTNPSDGIEINQTADTTAAGSAMIGLINPSGQSAVVNQKVGTVAPGSTVIGMVIE